LRLACIAVALTPPYVAAAALAAHAPREAAAAAVALLMPVAAVAALLAGRVDARLERTALRRAASVGIVSTFAIVLVAGLGAAAPVHAARSTPRLAAGSDGRLLTVSDQGRLEYWRVAWHEFASAPLHGTGAGTFELSWHRNRNTFYDVRDAHSLYLETLGETGPLGLVLLLAALAAPFVGAGAARRHALGPAVLAAYGAILLHAAVDWDWEMPAVMAAAFVCGVAAIAAGNPRRRRMRRGTARVSFAALVVLAVAAIGVQLGNASQSQAYGALHRSQFAAADRGARRAHRFEPWASEPLRILGEAELALRQTPRARSRFQQALAKDPNDWRLWYDLAAASTGRRQRAALAHALRLNPLEPTLLAFADRLRATPMPPTIR